MELMERITTDPNICGGRPCIRGLRVRVKDVVELVAAGVSHKTIVQDYPYLEEADIEAALRYAALQADHPVIRVA